MTPDPARCTEHMEHFRERGHSPSPAASYGPTTCPDASCSMGFPELRQPRVSPSTANVGACLEPDIFHPSAPGSSHSAGSFPQQCHTDPAHHLKSSPLTRPTSQEKKPRLSLKMPLALGRLEKQKERPTAEPMVTPGLCLPEHLLMGIWVVSSLRLSQIKPLGTFVYGIWGGCAL